jgi:ribonuclease III
MVAPIESLARFLGHRFQRPELLRQALTHASTARDRQGRHRSNERLEFLGDRVLGLVVADFLLERFPDEDEGELARRHAGLVRRETLARVAGSIGIGDHIVMSRGEEEAGGRGNPGLLADSLEAAIAALYLDGGLAPAAEFIRRHWWNLIEEDVEPPKDGKTTLQEWAQGRGLDLPSYREVDRSGPAHAPTFMVQVSVEGVGEAAAPGPSKRAAEQAAADALLEIIAGSGKEGGK